MYSVAFSSLCLMYALMPGWCTLSATQLVLGSNTSVSNFSMWRKSLDRMSLLAYMPIRKADKKRAQMPRWRSVRSDRLAVKPVFTSEVKRSVGGMGTKQSRLKLPPKG